MLDHGHGRFVRPHFEGPATGDDVRGRRPGFAFIQRAANEQIAIILRDGEQIERAAMHEEFGPETGIDVRHVAPVFPVIRGLEQERELAVAILAGEHIHSGQ